MTGVTLHTRIVRVARLLFPVAALALLSSLFLLTRTPNPDAAIPFSDVDVALLAREQRLTTPRIAGISDDGASYSISADLARPDPQNPRILSADALSVAIDGLDGGNTLFVQAGRGQVDTGAQTVQLAKDVSVRSSLGIVLNTDQLLADVGTMDVFAPSKITGYGPFGALSANSMRLSRDPATGEQLLLFQGAVTLLYQPE